MIHCISGSVVVWCASHWLWGFCIVAFCCALLFVLSSFAIILERKRELFALLLLFYGCLVTVYALLLFLSAVGWTAVCDCGFS